MFFFIIFSVHSCFFYSILCCILHESVSIVLSVLRTFCACTKFIICEFIIGILTRISTSIKIYMYVWPKWFNCRSKEPFWKASLPFCTLESQSWTQNALRLFRFLHFTVIVVVARNSSSHPCMTENKRRKLYVAKRAIRLRYRYKFAGHIIFDVTAASYYTSLCRRRSHSFKKKGKKKLCDNEIVNMKIALAHTTHRICEPHQRNEVVNFKFHSQYLFLFISFRFASKKNQKNIKSLNASRRRSIALLFLSRIHAHFMSLNASRR